MGTVCSLGTLVLYGVKDSNLQYSPTVIFQKHQNRPWHYDQKRKINLQFSRLYNFSTAEDNLEDGHSIFSETLTPTCQTARYHNHETKMKIIHFQEFVKY